VLWLEAQAKLAKLDFDQAKHEDLARQKAAAEQAVTALREVYVVWCVAPVGPAQALTDRFLLSFLPGLR